MTCLFAKVTNRSLQEKIWNCSKCNKKTVNIHNQGWARRGYSRQILSKRADKSRLTIDSFTMELVSNASGELFPDNTLSSFINFSPEQVNLEGNMRCCNFKHILHINVPKHNGGLLQVFWRETFENYNSTYNLEPGLYTSITDIVEAMNTLIQKRNNHNESCITVKVSRRSQKVVIILANDTSGLALCSADLGHIFGSNVGNQFGVLMKGKGPHEPQFAHDIVRIQSLMIYSGLV